MPGFKGLNEAIKAETDEALSLSNFTAGLLEQVIIAAGTTKLGAGIQGGKVTLRLGGVKFAGVDTAEAYQKLFYWLATKPAAMSVAEYTKRGALVEQNEKEDSDGVIELLAEGGLTEFGKQVQEYRQERTSKIDQALRQISPLPKEAEDLRLAVAEKTGLEDLTSQELLLVLGNLSRVAQPVTS